VAARYRKGNDMNHDRLGMALVAAFVGAILVKLALFAGLIYVIVHFVTKYW
jgi:hypothetical protein